MTAPRNLKVRPLGVSLARFTSALAISAAIVSAARGATVYWDADATALGDSISGAGLGGTGTWNTATLNWWDGNAADQLWNNAAFDTAVFDGTAGTVTLATPGISAGNLVFNTTGYTLAADVAATTLTLAGGANQIVNLGNRTGTPVSTTISAKLAGTNGLTLHGNGGTLTLNFAGTQALTGDLRLHSGTLLVKSATTTLASATGLTFKGASTFTYDNAGATGAKTQNLGALTFTSGDGTVRIERTADQDVTLAFSGMTRAAGATGMFFANGNVAVFGANATISAAGLPVGVTYQPGLFARTNANATGFAVYDSGNGFRPINYALDGAAFAATVGSGTDNIGGTNRHVQITGTQSAVATHQISTLNISGSGVNVTQNAGTTLTLSDPSGTNAGGLLKTGGGSSVIQPSGTNAATITAGGGRELVIRADALTDSLTISSTIANTTGALTKTGDGTVTLNGTQSYAGSTYVNGGKLTINGLPALGTGTATGLFLGGGTYELLANGDNGATVETLTINKNLTVTGPSTLSVAKQSGGTGTNKKFTFGTLSIGNDSLTASPVSTYSIELGATTLTDALPSTFIVTGTQPTSAAAGLTISGQITGATGIVKRGTGTLALTNNTNSFGGVGATIEIQEGLLSFNANNALGDANTAVVLNTLTSAEGLAATGGGSLSSGATRKLVLAGTNNGIEATSGTTLTWDGVVSGAAGAGLVKSGAGTLILANAGNSFGGAGSVIDLQGGVLQIASAGALGNAANTVQLNTAGASDAFRASATAALPQSFVLAQTLNRIDVPTGGNVLTLNGVVSSSASSTPLVKIGAGDLTLTNASNSFGGIAGSLIDIQGGNFTIANAGALGSPNNTLKLSQNGTTEKFVGDGTMSVRQGITLAQPAGTSSIIEVTPGNTMTLSGVVAVNGTNATDLVKRGGGTLVLANSGNTFGGAGRLIDIQAGILAASLDSALGAAANSVKLSATAAGEGFRAAGSFSTSRIFNLANTDTAVGNLIDVVPSSDLTLTSAFTFSNAANGLVKSGNGRLLLNAAQAGWNGNIRITGGALRASTATSLGTATGNTTISNSGSLELAGTAISYNEPLSIVTPGDNTTMAGGYFGGVLRSVATGTPSYTAAIAVNSSTFADNTSRSLVFGADSGTTLTLTTASSIAFDNGVGGTGRVVNLFLSGDGTGLLGSSITKTTGTVRLVKGGASTWTLNPTAVPASFAISAVEIRGGILVDAQSAGPGGGEVLPDTTALSFNGGGTFRYDNTASFAAKTETLASLAFNAGEGIVEIRRPIGNNGIMVFTNPAVTRTAGATGVFNANSNSATFGNVRFTFTGASAGFMDPGLYATLNAGAADFAWYDTAISTARLIAYGTDANSASVAGGASPFVANNYYKTTASITAQTTATIRSLSIAASSNVTLAAAQTLTINSGTGGGLLKNGGGTSIVSSGTGITSGSGSELIIRTDTGTDILNITTPILSSTGALTKAGLGTLNLSATNLWTGATYVNGGTLGILAPGALAGSSALSLNGGSLNVQLDGDLRSSLENIDLAKNLSVGATSAITVGRSSSTSSAALNKTVTFGSLSIGNQTLTVTGNNQYGVAVNAATNFTEALPATFNVVVGTSQASNFVPGLALNGAVTSSNGVGFIKTGTGALLLGNNAVGGGANTFGGAGAVIDIQAGFVGAGSDEALGNANNGVLLNTNTSSTGFRATGTFATNRTFTLNQASNAIEVTQGNVLTLNQPLNLSAVTNTLAKNDNGVLELGADNAVSWTGAVSINAGAIRLKTAAGFGAGTHTITLGTAVGTALQLSGNNVTYNAYALPAMSGGGINSAGALENVSGTNTWAGAINLSGASTIGSTSGSLTLTGAITTGAGTSAQSLTLAGAGAINLTNSPLPALSALTKVGTGTATLSVASPAFVAPLNVNAGTFTIRGSGVLIGDTGAIAVGPNGTLRVDDSVGAPMTRLAARPITLQAGNFRYDGNAANSAETLGVLTVNAGQSSITTVPSPGKTLNLTIPSLTLGSDTAIAFTGSGLGTPEHRILFTAVPGVTNSMYPRFTVNGSDFATYIPQQSFNATTSLNSTTVVLSGTNVTRQMAVGQIISGNANIPAGARIAQIIDGSTIVISIKATATDSAISTTFSETGIAAFNPAAYQDNPNINNAATTDTVIVTVGTTTNNITVNRTFNALKFSGNGLSVGGLDRSILTLSSGGLLSTGGSNAITASGLAFGGAQAMYHVDAGATLRIDSAISGTAGMVKAGPGLLILNSAPGSIAGVGGNTGMTGTHNINAGTVQFGTVPGTSPNLFAPNVAVRIGPGATLDLNGNVQLMGPLLTDSTLSGTGGALGQVTSSAPGATLVVNQDNNARNWSGNITGPVSFSRSGQNTFTVYSPQTYTGVTQFNGGTTVLRDGGALSGTTSIDIAYATLTLENKLANGSLMDSADRINNAATVGLRGATLNFNGREQSTSSETLGAVSVTQGFSTVTVTPGGTGVNSADLIFGSLTHPVGSTGTVNFNSVLGAIGNQARVQITSAPTLTNKIIGGWAINQADFASFNPGLGVGALGSSGYAAYDFAPATYTFTGYTQNATANVKIPLATTSLLNVPVVANNFVANSLNVVSTGAGGGIGVSVSTDTINLTSGGFLHSGSFDSSIGTPALPGRITAGGSASSGTSEFYIYNRANTLTLNSRVIDTSTALGSGTANVRLVVTASGGTIAISNPNNSHTGGTVLNGGTLTLTGTTPSAGNLALGQAEIPAGGLTVNGGTVTMTLNAGQIHPNNVVTLNSASTLTLFGDNTLAGLVFDNNGGTAAPTVNTFASSTAGGTLSIGASGVVASSSNVGATSLIAGRLSLGAGLLPFLINPIAFNGAETNPAQATLIVQGIANTAGGITKNGTGVLQFNAQDTFTGPVNVTAGGIQYGATNAGSRFSAVTLAGGTRLNLANVSTVIGSLSGSGLVTNNAGSQTLTVGFNNTNTVFSGQIMRFGDAVLNAVNLTKIGTGKLELTGAGSDSTGVINVQGGEINYHGAASSLFATNQVTTKGTLTLDNTATNGNNRFGGATTFGTLNINGGEFKMLGNSGADTTETQANFTVSSGSGVITLLPDPNSLLTLKIGTTFTAQQTGGTVLIRGLTDNLVPGIGEATIDGTVATFNASALAGNGSVSTEFPVRADMIGDTSPTGLGTSFITKDPFTNQLRVLDPFSETSGFLPNGATTQTNYNFTDLQTINENTTAFSVVLQDTAGIDGVTLTSGRYSANGSVLTQTISSGGVLSTADAVTTLSVPLIQSTGNLPLIFHVLGTSGQLTVTSDLNPGTGGMTKSGSGELVLSGRVLSNGTTTVNDGKLTLAGAVDNSIAVTAGATTSGLSALTVNGGTLDLNGRNQAFGALSNNNPNAMSGGTVTNTGATATLTTATGSGTTFAGVIAGAINLVKAGSGTLILSSPNTYTGTTTLRGGGLTLRDKGSVLNTSAIDLNYGTLLIDQQGLNSSGALSPARLTASVPITLHGATVTLTAGGSMDATATLNSLLSDSGANTINAGAVQSAGSTSTLNLGNLSRTAGLNSTVNFVAGVGGTLGNPGLNNPHIFLNTLNGAPVVLANKIIGPWAIANGSNFATVKNASAPFEVGELGNTGQGFQAYDSTDITAATPTANVNDGANRTLPSSRTINTLRVAPNAANTLTLNPGVTLTLGNGASGGLLTNNNTTYNISGTASAALTSGGSELFVFVNQNTTTIGVPVVDGGSALSLVKSGGGTLTLTGVNTYTGMTIVSQGTLSLNTPAADGGSVVAVPGDLLINNATVTLQQSKQLTTTAQVTIDGAGTLNMVSTNTIGGIVFNNRGGNANPTVATANLLTVSGSNAITSTNHSLANTPVVSGSELALSHLTPTITTAGAASNSLLISAPIHSAGGAIVKAGAGSLALNPTLGAISSNTNTTPGTEDLVNVPSGTGAMKPGMSISGTGIPAGSYILNVVNGNVVQISQNATTAATNNLTYNGSTVNKGFTIDAGTVILDQSSTFGAGVVQSGPLGTGTLTLNNGAALVSDGTIRTIHNSVQVNGNFTLGALAASSTALAGGGVIMAGAVNLSAGAHAVDVNSEINLSTISGQVTGSGSSLDKTGPGTLVLTNPANNWNGPLAISNGVLRNGASGAIPTTDLTIANAGQLDMNGIDQTVKTLSGGGSVANSSSILPATLYVGGTLPSDTTSTFNSTFSGSISGSLSPFGTLGVTKVGAGTFTLSGSSNYRGQTNVNSGVLRVVEGSPGDSLTIFDSFTVNAGAAAEIYGKVSAGGSGLMQTNGVGSVIRGNGTLDVNTTITAGGAIQSLLGPGNTHLKISDHTLTMGTNSTLLFQTIKPASGFTSDGGSLMITGSFGDVALDTGNWTVKLQNVNVLVPILYTFVLFDGDIAGTNLNGNGPFSDLVGNYSIDFGTTGWSLAPGGGIHYDFDNNDIILTGVVPEPNTSSMLLGGCAIALGLKRFRRRQRA